MSLRTKIEEATKKHPGPWKVAVLDANGNEVDVAALDSNPKARDAEGKHNFLRVATALANS